MSIRSLVESGGDPYSKSWDGTDAFHAAIVGYTQRRRLRGLTGVHPELETIESALRGSAATR